MMKRFFVILISCLWLAVPLFAQSNKLIRELESKRGALQKQIAESESILKDTKKDVGSQLNSLAVLTGQIEERKRYIMAINNDVEAIQRELASLERQLHGLEKDLKDKKKKYEASVQYLYKNKSIEEKLMFIFSAKNLGQTYRRMRYVREYATYQRLQGEEILKKQEQIRKKKAERQQVKAAKENLLQERESEKVKLEEQEKEKRTLVTNLQKKQKGLQNEINKKRREANLLNARIDKLIAEEIERARKRAQEEARREAAARKKEESKEGKSAELASLERQLHGLEKDLKDKKKKYEASVQYLYKNKSIEEKLMFIFSAKNLGQTYRRMRYVREYATYQRLQGEEILKKQEQIRKKKAERQQVKAAKENLLQERESEKVKLEEQEKEKRTLVTNLQKKQKGLQNEINKKRREANLLNARIDKLIAEEIERARKRAQEEARREAAARKKEESKEGKSAATETAAKSKPLEAYTMSKADRELSGNFAANRGKLPMPISGAYIITSRYGQYAVEGLRNVKLDNKGIDIQGKPGAQARAIFDGKVAAVFQLNGLFNVLIRHGNYISVYCNLSSASVKAGDTVKTKQSIGQVFSDGTDNGRTVLHFQLRREKEKLNPEPWLNR